MTALSAITIKGFRSIGSVEDLAIRPINVLIGANGAGKSNFLGVFKLLQAIRAGGLQKGTTYLTSRRAPAVNLAAPATVP